MHLVLFLVAVLPLIFRCDCGLLRSTTSYGIEFENVHSTSPPATTPNPSPKKQPLTTHKPLKPKFTTTTTRKPTRPTLPPSVYVKPSISKVIVPPFNSLKWNSAPLRTGWQSDLITTTPAGNDVLQSSQNFKEDDFGLFLTHLRDFTKRTEHNHQIKYKRFDEDPFDYYYEIYNHYHNGHLAAKNYRVLVSSLKNCQANTSKVMCLPNTNSMCLTNGTILCVTHFSVTIPCENYTTSCAITYAPCDGRYRSCIGKNESLYVGVPCISKVLLVPSTNDFYKGLTVSPIQYCVTSVINPKPLFSPVGPFMSVLVQTGRHHYNILKNSTATLAKLLSS